jgi:hypothetical protein
MLARQGSSALSATRPTPLRPVLRGPRRPRPLHQGRGRLPIRANGDLPPPSSSPPTCAKRRRRLPAPPPLRHRLSLLRAAAPPAHLAAPAARRSAGRQGRRHPSRARLFRLSSSGIRNVLLAAASIAADADGLIGMPQLVRGTRVQEARRLAPETEVQRLHHLLQALTLALRGGGRCHLAAPSASTAAPAPGTTADSARTCGLLRT